MKTQKRIRSHGALVSCDIVLKLTEGEARALKSITVYGTTPFLDWFKANLGKCYLEPHEAGLISLFETIKAELPPHLNRIDRARKVFEETPL